MAKPRTPLIRTTKTKIDDLNARFRAARLRGVTAQAPRHGRIVVYYRKTLGDPKVRLRADALSPAFFAEYADVREGRTLAPPVAAPTRRPPTGNGTLRCIIEGYYGSTDYLAKRRALGMPKCWCSIAFARNQLPPAIPRVSARCRFAISRRRLSA
jgi:hypothetical protein